MRLAVILLVAALAVCPVLCATDCTAEAESSILISEVQSKGTEGFSLYNTENYNIDLKGYYLSDGEGKVSFTKSLMLAQCSSITISFDINSDQTFLNRPENPNLKVFQVGTNGIVAESRFKLADAGDDLYLYDTKNKLLDSVCWGNKIAEGWYGRSNDKPTNDRYLVRCSYVDTNTSADWKLTRPGMTDLNSSTMFNADVIPFTFPECHGIEIYNALESAKNEVLISIYQITSKETISLLCLLAHKGIDVTVLLEGSPLGTRDSTNLERTLMKSLVDSGGTVRLINDSRSNGPEDFGDRFTYVHTKYAVIDGITTIITSENWTESNMGPGDGNRGWGVVIHSEGYASYMRSIFLNDSSKSYGDCKDMMELYPDQSVYEGDLTYSDPDLQYDYSNCSVKYEGCIVSPVLSPDNSYDALRSFIDGAETRVYSEQMDMSNSYLGISNDSPVSWMVDAASRGVDSKLILDLTSDTGGKSAEVGLINTTTDLKAAGINGGDGFRLTHNKGVIVDDSVWVGSINWTDTSFFRNRESAVIIKSIEVSDHFASYFLKDWVKNDRNSEINVEILNMLFEFTGDFGCFEVNATPDYEYTYEWDIYGDGSLLRTSSIPKITYEGLEAGEHNLIVKVIEKETGRSAVIEVAYTVSEGSGDTDNINAYSVYVIIGMAALTAVVGLIRSERSTSNKEKRRR